MGDTSSDHELLAEVVRRIEPADVADRMVSAFRAQIAGYKRLPQPVVLGQILAIARANAELFFRSVLEDAPATDDDLAPFRASAKDRAGEGMPLEDLLHAYRLGGRFGWQAMAEAAEPAEQRALLLGAELLMEYVDRVSAAVAQAYLDERQHLVSEEERRLRDLFDALVGGEPVRAGLRDLAERIGFPLADSYRPFAEILPGAGAPEHSQIAAELRDGGVLALTEGDRVSGLARADGAGRGGAGGREAPAAGVKASASADGAVDVPVAEGALLAIGDSTPRAELAGALDEMRLLADLGTRMGRTGEVTATAFLPELLLARSPRLAALLQRRALGALEDYPARRGTDLLATLATFVDCGLDRRRAAQRLHVHPNTLDYRLGRVEELTGLELGRPDDLMLIALALKQRALASTL